MTTGLIKNIDYSYIDRMIANIKHSLKLVQEPLPLKKGVVLSIHLQSNRPDNFTQFLDNLEASIDDPANIEVIVKIDDTDVAMNELLPREVARRAFVVKFISTPLDGGFFELWRSMNDILDVCDPNAYFLWNMNDEMAVVNKGWDTALKKYVGLFPDHIFRLRTSLFRLRNYCDFWENGFAPETSAINTKRWIEIGGNWNPCLGPDSFQQCVAYYFAYHDRFNKHKPLREVPIHDITFHGEGANLGISGDKLWRRVRGATKAWYRLMSYPMQLEASRRAQKLHAYIAAYNNRFEAFEVTDNLAKKAIVLTDKETNRDVRVFSYKLSRTRIFFTNLLRSPYYLYYGGGAARADWKFIPSLIKFLALRYDAFQRLYGACKGYSHYKPRVQMLFFRRLGIIRDKILESAAPLKPLGRCIPAFVRSVAYRTAQRFYGRMADMLNMGYPFRSRFTPYGMLVIAIDWEVVDASLNEIVLPERFNDNYYRRSIIRCLLLQHWYGLTTEQLQAAAEVNQNLRFFTAIHAKLPFPEASAIRVFKAILEEHGTLQHFYDAAARYVNLEMLPPLKQTSEKTVLSAVA